MLDSCNLCAQERGYRWFGGQLSGSLEGFSSVQTTGKRDQFTPDGQYNPAECKLSTNRGLPTPKPLSPVGKLSGNDSGLLQLGGTVYSSSGSSSSIWSPAVTESGGGFPGDHQRLAWTTTASQQQCYQNYSSYYTNMDYLSPATHQLNVVVSTGAARGAKFVFFLRGETL